MTSQQDNGHHVKCHVKTDRGLLGTQKEVASGASTPGKGATPQQGSTKA